MLVNRASSIEKDLLYPRNLDAVITVPDLLIPGSKDRTWKKPIKIAFLIERLSFVLLNNIAGFYREELSYNKAIDYYKQALLVNPNNAYIYNNLAKIYFDLNDHQEAMKNSFKGLEMKNNDGDIQKTIT